MEEQPKRGRPPKYETAEEAAQAKRDRDAASKAARMKDEAYRESVNEKNREWRRANPEKVAGWTQASTDKRKQRVEADPDYAEKIRARARSSAAERAKRATTGPWKLVVRLKGESRGKAVADLIYLEDKKTLRGLKRVKSKDDAPKVYTKLSKAQKDAESLLEQFPTKVEAAYAAVI